MGSHKRGLREHVASEVYGFSLGLADYDEQDEASCVPVPAEPGDLICHHSLTIHRADGNSTDRPRRACGVVHYGASCKRDEAAAQAHGDKVHAEWAEQGRE